MARAGEPGGKATAFFWVVLPEPAQASNVMKVPAWHGTSLSHQDKCLTPIKADRAPIKNKPTDEED